MKDLKEKLKKYNQEHLLKYYEELDDNEKKHLLNQIDSIDFELINDLYKDIKNISKEENISSMESFKSNKEYEKIGLETVKQGKYALVTMAGGQGTRLGFDGPKGCYILEYGINKSLFEIQCDELKEIRRKSNLYIPWLIMTSYDNNKETIKFFKENNYFNYPKDKIRFFNQEELPIVDKNGKILMDSKFNIVMGANGHGGVFSALHNNGLIDELKKLNIEWIFIGGIDNILLPVDDLDLIGFSIKNKFLAASRIVLKGYPEEKVGVFCLRNDKPSVIEYIEMTPEMSDLRDESGNLLYRDAHILCNLFNIKVLEKIAEKKLKYFSAFKKIDYIDEKGNFIKPEKENAYKFECFIFDAFSYFNKSKVGLLQGEREEVFAPIKNASGVDSPETAAKLYNDYHNKGGR